MRGLKRLNETIGFANFWDTNHTKPQPDFRDDADREDWAFYQELRSGNAGLSPKNFVRGDKLFAFAAEEDGQAGGDNIEILSPTNALIHSCNLAGKSNDLSIVLQVKHAGRSVLLPGDAEDEAWNNMVAYYGGSLKSDFLKASHHGRDSGYNHSALKLIDPVLTFTVTLAHDRSHSTWPDAPARDGERPVNIDKPRFGGCEIKIISIQPFTAPTMKPRT